MFKMENHIGNIVISEKYLKQLAEYTVKSCFGVAGISCSGVVESIISKICPNNLKNGINLYVNENNIIIIELHIIVAFGVNIREVVKSVTHKVGFAVSEALGDVKCSVTVFVDDVINS